MAHFLELEQVVGRCWHRWASAAQSYPGHPEAAVALDELRERLAVFYHGLGGPGGVRLAAASRSFSSHRLSLRQRLGLGKEELVDRPTLDWDTMLLPQRIDCFPERKLNEKLYLWLAAYFAHAGAATRRPRDPLQADLLALRAAHATTRRVLEHWPGLRGPYAVLTEAVRNIRPRRSVTGWEAAVEEAILHLLGADGPMAGMAGQALDAIVDSTMDRLPFKAPRGYRSFLPVPLWGDVVRRGVSPDRGGDEEPGGRSAEGNERRFKARRRASDQAQRNDQLVFNRFEYVLSVAEMVNVNRSVEDDDLDAARQAADTLEAITVGHHRRGTASRLRLDLELSPQAVDTQPLATEHAYPEWDYTRHGYHRDHCRVVAEPAGEGGEDWKPDAAAWRCIRAVKRQFEAFRPRRQVLTAQSDGDELDLCALVRSFADRRSGGAGSDRVYLQARHAARDLAVAVLVDASLSTDSWIDNRRILDVEKEAVLALTHGLTACGDDHAVFSFTSRQRKWVSVTTLKDFDEPLNERVRRRLQALKPGYYTRIGAALRHVAGRLGERPNRHRLLLLLTDGKPNDLDHYEGRYGVEDTRRAIREARSSGLAVFGITVDSKAREYFPYLFGRGAFAIVGRIGKLPAALPAIYHHITR